MNPRPAPTTRPKPAVRSTAIRDRHRAIIAKNRPPCALCGSPLDYTLVYPDPWCFVVDHKIPLNQGGSDALDNKQAAHNHCNRAKSDRLDGGNVLFKSGFFD